MSDKTFVLHCPRCNFGSQIDFFAIEVVCPQCGTVMRRATELIVRIEGFNLWLSEEQFQKTIDQTVQFASRLLYQRGQGGRAKVGG